MTGSALGKSGNIGVHPIIKYCMAIPMTLETIQYRARPLGNDREKKAIISGIIHSIMVWLPCCRGSVDGIMVIFCWIQVVTNTNMGMGKVSGSDSAKSNQRNFGSRGAKEKVAAKGQKV